MNWWKYKPSKRSQIKNGPKKLEKIRDFYDGEGINYGVK